MKKIYQSKIEPKDTSVVWLNPETLEIKTFINGSWKTLTASSNNTSGGEGGKCERFFIKLDKKSTSTESEVSTQEQTASTFNLKKDIDFIRGTALQNEPNLEVTINDKSYDEFYLEVEKAWLSGHTIELYLEDGYNFTTDIPTYIKGVLRSSIPIEGLDMPILMYAFEFDTFTCTMAFADGICLFKNTAKKYDPEFPSMDYTVQSSGSALNITAPVITFQCTANSNYTGYANIPFPSDFSPERYFFICKKTYAYGSTWTPSLNPLVFTLGSRLQAQKPYADKDYYYEVIATRKSLTIKDFSSDFDTTTVTTLDNEEVE